MPMSFGWVSEISFNVKEQNNRAHCTVGSSLNFWTSVFFPFSFSLNEPQIVYLSFTRRDPILYPKRKATLTQNAPLC